MKKIFHAFLITYVSLKSIKACIKAFTSAKKKKLPDITRSRCIFITGAASGIGKEVAQLFLNKGWFVGCYDINFETLEELYANIDPNTCCFKKIDVTDEGSCENAINHFTKLTDNKMDVLFNCAGILSMGYFNKLPLQPQLAQIQVNFFGLAMLTYKAFPILKRTENSQVINMSSLSASAGMPYHAVYAATKAAVYSLTESLSIEFEQHDIRVADMSPGYLATPMVINQTNKNIKSVEDESKWGSPSDVAHEVWKAVNDYHVDHYHYYVNRETKFFFQFTRLLEVFGASGRKRKALGELCLPLNDNI